MNSRRHLLVAGVIWVVLTVAGITLVQLTAAGGFPFLASEEGAVVDDAILFLLFAVVPVFMFVLVVIGYAMTRFRVRPDDVRDSTSQPRTNRAYTLTWLGATAALAVLVTVHPGITGLIKIWDARDKPDPLVVNVTAQQWNWAFAYPDQGLENQTELVLPVGKPVKFMITSTDVIHSFWVPAFRIKEDAVPGTTRELVLTPDRVGSTGTSSMMRVQCAELCGMGHAEMNAVVRIVTPSEFSRWVAQQGSEQ